MKNAKKFLAILTVLSIVLTQLAFTFSVSADDASPANSSDYTLNYQYDETTKGLSVIGFKDNCYPTAEYDLVIPDTAEFDIDGNGTIEENEKAVPVTKIGEGAFATGYNKAGAFAVYGKKVNNATVVNDILKSVTIGKNVVAIAGTSAGTITVPDTVTSLSYLAQYSYFTNVYIGKGVARLDYRALRGCSKVTELTTYATFINKSAFDSSFATGSVCKLYGDTVKISNNAGTEDAKLVVTNTPSFETRTTAVKDYLLSVGYTIDNIAFGVSIPLNENNALSYLVSGTGATLKGFDVSGDYLLPVELELVIPEKITVDGSEYTVTKIADYAFAKSNYDGYDKENASSVIYNNLYICALKSVVIPDTVTEIGVDAFRNNDRLTSAVIPAATFGNATFQGCRFLTDVTLKDGITAISSNMFNGCQRLTKLIIPASVTEISMYAFYGTSNLKNIMINGDNVAIVGKYNGGGSVSGTVFHVKNDTIKTAVEESEYNAGENIDAVVIIGQEAMSLSFSDNKVIVSQSPYLDRFAVLIATYTDADCKMYETAKIYTGTNDFVAYSYPVTKEEGKYYKAFIFNGLDDITPLVKSLDF